MGQGKSEATPKAIFLRFKRLHSWRVWLLEVPSVAEIARAGLTPAQLKQLRHLAEATKRAADDGNLIEFLETDRKFHVGLIATLGNKPLADLVETLRDRVRLHGFTNGSTCKYIAQSASQHFQLLDALSKRDEAGAVAVMRRHLERSSHVWSQSDHTAHS